MTDFEDVTPLGDWPYDSLLRDVTGDVKVQVKMQRRLRGLPFMRKGEAVVEVQRTRSGQDKDGFATRPYRFGEFDILAVCMEPSHDRWDSFLYIPERWLLARKQDAALIEILQPLSLKEDAVWTSDFPEAVRRLRSGMPRPSKPADDLLNLL